VVSIDHELFSFIVQTGQAVFERGFLFGIVVCALYISSWVIRSDDLTVEGSFGLAGAVTAMLLTAGVHWLFAMCCAVFAGLGAGLSTGLINTKLGVNNLIAGVIVTTALFSVQLKIGGAHLAISRAQSIFSELNSGSSFMILSGFTIAVVVAISWFLKTEIGLLLYAVGQNPRLLITLGKSPAFYKTLGFALSNGLTALAGSLFVQYTGFFSIWSSVGILIIGLAGLIIAQMMHKGFGFVLILGSLIYQIIISCTYELNIDPDLNKLVTALLILVLLLYQKREQKDTR
jgi:putative tryptophan/tyrosine transport system permease protein